MSRASLTKMYEFEVKNGKIVEASANDSKRINNLLDTDEGARYLVNLPWRTPPYPGADERHSL